MIIGFVIPLTIFLMGNLFHVLDNGIEVDFELGDTCITFLPLSLHSICGGLLVFGTIGTVLYEESHMLKTNIIAFTGGYFVAVIIQIFINYLKRMKHGSYSNEELVEFEAKVVNTIIPNGFGSISIQAPDGVTRTYPAKCEDAQIRIPSSTKVKVLYFEKNVAYVQEVEPVEE